MSKHLSSQEIEFIIERLQAGEPLPEDMRYKLFPTRQKEYELAYGGKMRKEDILANQDGVCPVPLQVEKVFNGERETWPNGWRNMIVFGDNLQFLKTCYQDKDDHIKGKVKGKVKLIYIDPPFGTGDEYDGNKGQAAYSAKQKGADFVEYIRRRAILGRELLSQDGWFFMRQGNHFGHHIKLVLDEIFGKHNFVNELIVNRVRKAVTKKGKRNIPNAVDHIYCYRMSEQSMLLDVNKKLDQRKEGYWHGMDSPGIPGPRSLIIESQKFFPPKGTHFKFPQEQADEMYKAGKLRINPRTKKLQYWVEAKDETNLDSNWTDIPGYTFSTGYPTENSEQLLERILRAATLEGDLILDFFGGSGTTAAVAEKLGRKWIHVDIGKLSFYTVQKRLLYIQASKDLNNPKLQYAKAARSFITLNTGHYNLEKVFALEHEKYRQFVMNLFEVTPTPGKKVGGISIDGERPDTYLVHIYPYWQFPNAVVDEVYLDSLYESIRQKAGDRFYIIAPVNHIGFISDYYEIEGVRFYFLKVPYHIIRELHKEQFKKFRQPQSQKNVNDLEDAVGFHFMRQPEVSSELIFDDAGNPQIKLRKFRSCVTEDGTGRDLQNFESLAMVLIDPSYNGTEFKMAEYFFAEDLLPKKTRKKNKSKEESIDEEEPEQLSAELLQQAELSIPSIPAEVCGDTIMAIYVDIYGNEFKETFQLKK